MTDRDNLIARLHAGNQKGQVQCCRTVGDRTGVRRADHFGEFALEGGDLGALRDPAAQDRTPRGLGLRFTHHRFGDRNQLCRLTASNDHVRLPASGLPARSLTRGSVAPPRTVAEAGTGREIRSG